MGKNTALGVNKLSGSSFPLVFKYTEFERSYGIFVSALTLLEVADIVIRFAYPILNIFEVDHYDERSLKEIILEHEVPFHAYDSENVALDSCLLPKLLDGFVHYNFHLFDTQCAMEETDYVRAMELIDQPDSPRARIIDRFKESNLWIDSHDDCYFYAESRIKSFIEHIVVRALNSLCASVLEPSEAVPINIAPSVINKLLVKERPTTILQYPKISNGAIRWPVYFSVYPWRTNGDITSEKAFKVPNCYFVLDTYSGECVMKDGDSV